MEISSHMNLKASGVLGWDVFYSIEMVCFRFVRSTRNTPEILFDFSEHAARLERAGGSTHDAHSQFYLHYSHIAAI